MSEFVDNLSDVFALFGPITAKRMFGGYGIYHEGVMFALVADETLYFKVDDASVGEFEALGLTPFEYERSGKRIKMSYYLAPETIFDDTEAASTWARLAYEAARRNK